MGEPKLPLGASKFAAFHSIIYYFTRLAGSRRKGHLHVMPFTHKQTLLCCSLRSVNLGSTLAFHMTEVECEIPAQTFMRADLHYITSVPHHGRQEWERGVGGGTCTSVVAGSRTAKEIEKMVSQGSRGWGCVSPRLLSLPASQTWLHCGFPACRCDLTRADGDRAMQH